MELKVAVFFLSTINLGWVAAQDCDNQSCDVCCYNTLIGSDYKNVCTENEMNCRVDPNPNKWLLWEIVVLTILFIAGIPVVILSLKYLLIRRIQFFKLSFVEVLLNFVCKCSLIRRQLKPKKTSTAKLFHEAIKLQKALRINKARLAN